LIDGIDLTKVVKNRISNRQFIILLKDSFGDNIFVELKNEIELTTKIRIQKAGQL